MVHPTMRLTRFRVYRLAVLAGALVLAVSACSVAKSTPTPLPTSTPRPTLTPPPTSTPAPTATPPPLDLVVVYSSDTVGYTEPCG